MPPWGWLLSDEVLSITVQPNVTSRINFLSRFLLSSVMNIISKPPTKTPLGSLLIHRHFASNKTGPTLTSSLGSISKGIISSRSALIPIVPMDSSVMSRTVPLFSGCSGSRMGMGKTTKFRGSRRVSSGLTAWAFDDERCRSCCSVKTLASRSCWKAF